MSQNGKCEHLIVFQALIVVLRIAKSVVYFIRRTTERSFSISALSVNVTRTLTQRYVSDGVCLQNANIKAINILIINLLTICTC